MNPLRLDIQGGEQYLPFAKKKLRELKVSMKKRGITCDNRYFVCEDAEIYIQSSFYVSGNLSAGVAGDFTGGMGGKTGGGAGGNSSVIDIGGGTNSGADSGSIIGAGGRSINIGTYHDAFETSGGMDLIRIRGHKKPLTLILIHIAQTDAPFAVLTKDDYRVLTYKIVYKNATPTQLLPVNQKIKTLSIEDAGQNLVIQSSTSEILATLPSVFTFNPLIDNTDAMDRTWAAIDELFGQSRRIGSAKAMVPDTNKLVFSYNARRNYVSDSLHTPSLEGSGKSRATVTSMDFRWRSTHLGFGLFYVGLLPYNGGVGRAKVRWHIQYREPSDPQWKDGILIGEDYEDPNPFDDGYTWKYHLPIAALSPTKALLKTVKKEQLKSRFGGRLVRIDVHIDVLHRCSREIREAVFYWPCEFGLTYYYETLKMGDITLENLTYSEYTLKHQNIDIESWMVPVVANKTWCGDWPNYLVDFQAAINLTGADGMNLPTLKMYYDGKTIHPAIADGHFKHENTGDRDLHVMMYDNLEADDTFIVFYMFNNSTVRLEGYYEPGIMAVNNRANESTTHYMMAYRLKGSELKKRRLASLSQDGAATTSIDAVSCQIHRGYIVYTYRLYAKGVFKHRVIGIININSGQEDEFISYDKEPKLVDFRLSGLAAIGLA
ncbi:MAG: hypothetical protein HQL06_13730 [Nitrospirae bacterium]|nr:hypothetical protein [Nitrospirota bacterium]